MWGKKYRYKVRFVDSLDHPYINETEMGRRGESISQAEAEDLLLEQLNANNLYPKWVQVIEMTEI